MSPVLVGLAVWAAFCFGFLAGGVYATGVVVRRVERTDERMRTLRFIEEMARWS